MQDMLKEAKDAFAECEDAESYNRKAALEDLRFARLGDQWPQNVRRQREIEGRPCLTINKLPSFIRQVVNDARQNKPAIKIHPADSYADPDTANVMNGIIRNIEYTSRADVAYDTAIDFAASMGFGYFRIITDYASDDSFDIDIGIKRVANPFTIYGDPYSEEADSSDWNTAFVTEMLKKEEFLRRYPGVDTSDWNSTSIDEHDQHWFDEDSIRIAEYWTRDEVVKNLLLLSDGQILDEDTYIANKDIFDVSGLGVVNERPTKSHKVKQCIVSGSDVLEQNDWAGRYIPIIPVYGEEINVEGKRQFMSLIRQAKDAQQMFNYWRTASTELVALAPKAPYIGPKGAFSTDSDKWATANNISHAYIEYEGSVSPQRQPFTGVPAGALQEAMNASDDMKSIMGLYDASLGARSNETSGRAIMARQREGDVSTFHFIDNMTRSIRHAGSVLIDLIPHVYNQERVVRVMGEDGTPENVPVNQPVVVDGVDTMFDLTSGKYDLTVTSGPSFTSRREEAATQMIELGRSNPDVLPVIGDLIVKNLDWPGAEDIADRLKSINPYIQQQEQQENPQPDPELMKMEAEAQMEREKHAMNMEIKNAELQKKNIELEERAIERDLEIAKLNTPVMPETMVDERQNQLIAENTAALGQIAQSQEALAGLVTKLAGEQNMMMAEAVAALPDAIQASNRPKTVRTRRENGELVAEIQ